LVDRADVAKVNFLCVVANWTERVARSNDDPAKIAKKASETYTEEKL